MERTVIVTVHHTELGLADACRVLQHGLEHRLQLARRTADDLQHLGGRGLLLQRLAQIVGALAQLVEQPGILDGDHGLRGEVLDQLDLLIAERPDLLAIDGDGADQFALLEHGNKEVRSCAGGFHEGYDTGVAIDIARLRRDVGNVDDTSGSGEAVERVRRIVADQKDRVLAPSLGIGRRRILLGNDTKRIFLIEKQIAEFRFADAHRFLQHGLEHGL